MCFFFTLCRFTVTLFFSSPHILFFFSVFFCGFTRCYSYLLSFRFSNKPNYSWVSCLISSFFDIQLDREPCKHICCYFYCEVFFFFLNSPICFVSTICLPSIIIFCSFQICYCTKMFGYNFYIANKIETQLDAILK